jgi:hypothetical protein
MKLACPYVSRRGGGRSATASVINEGIQVPQDAWQREVAKNPALESTNKAERAEATKKAILGGELAKYRRR